ncbi:hypothetical protein [Nocardioides ochotonae]|uniref:hypothetical protein n=1 Tax=Nocardioides ochotonae TaxID=2685869 RepID=UPI00140B5050|nr:hypothetical protein [Nocardioides ochotonae]
MTTIPVSETAPAQPGTPRSPQQSQQPSSPAPDPRPVDRLAALLGTVRDVLLALLDLGRAHTRTAWSEIRATTPPWFPTVFLTWCVAAAVLAAAFAVWVLLVMLTTG